MQIEIPPQMIAIARAHGADLPATMEVDAQGPLLELATQLSPGADFGFVPFRKVAAAVRNVAKKAAPKAAGSGALVKRASTVAFGIKSSATPMAAAMAAADRLLGDPKIKNAQNVVNATQALAALGDPAAKRGLITLQAVSAIRQQAGAQPGQKVIKAQPLPNRAVAVQRSTAQVRRMAAKTAAQPKRQGVVQRIITWFKLTF